MKQSRAIYSHSGKPLGDQVISVSNTAVKTLNLPEEGARAFVTVEKDPLATQDNLMRWRETGENPDSNTGHILKDGDLFELRGAALKGFKVIGLEAGMTHTLQITYYSA